MIDRIIDVAVHDLKKEAGSTSCSIVFGHDKLPLNKTVVRVVNELDRLYGKRASKAHGKFASDPINFPAQTFIKDFYDESFQNFANLTRKLIATLSVKAGSISSAVGGHVLFAHFEHDKQSFLMVAVVTDKLGALLTNKLDMQDVEHLDLDGFRYAGRVNITGWQSGSDRYIGFLKGTGDVAKYFEQFLGCDVAIDENDDTERLIEALKDFAVAQKDKVPDVEGFLQKAHDMCADLIKGQKEINFNAFSNEILPSDPDVLKEHLGTHSLNLSDGFIPDKRPLANLIRIKAKTKLWSIEFSRTAIAQGAMSYDDKKKTVTLHDLPDHMVQELEKNKRRS
ncbi:nucleoid-associated protein [Rhizobium ruizarguesonis]